MPLRFEVELKDAGEAALARIADNLQDRTALHQVLGKRGEIELRDHFQARNEEPNSRGWPKQQFWARIRTATAYTRATVAGAEITIADPAFNQKYYGGTITPKEGKYLALPAIAEAYGRSPRSVDVLQFYRFKSGAAALIENAFTRIKIGRKRKDGSRKVKAVERSQRGRVWYWLVRSVTQRKDERALPESERFKAALGEETADFFERLAA